ncbi:MAG: type II secretion system F family protein [Casimicrobium sp.]
MNVIDRWIAKASFGAQTRLEVYEKLRAAAADGISLKHAVDDLQEIYARHRKTRPLAGMFEEWSDNIAAGKAFHNAVGDWLPQHERMVLASSANRQSLVAALDAITTQVGAAKEMQSAIYGAMVTPLVYLIIITGIMIAVATRLLPELLQTMERNVALENAWLFITTAEFIAAAPWALPVLVALCVLTLVALLPFEFPLRRYLDKWVPFNFYVLLQGSAFLMAIAGLTRVGTPQFVAVQLVHDSGRPWLRARLGPAIDAMQAGKQLGASLDATGYEFPTQKIIDDIAFYEKRSKSDIAIERAATRWLVEGKRKANALAVTSNFVGMVVMAGVLLWITANIAFLMGKTSFLSGL